MKISIAERLHPFSHLPGIECLIPATSYVVRAFPTKIEIFSLAGELRKTIPLPCEGHLLQFTVMQDLERGCVTVWSEGYHLHILPTLEWTEKKHPPSFLPAHPEKLSLGSHKKQEWEAIKKRRDLCEIFPIWFRLGAQVGPENVQDYSGKAGQLLEACRKTIALHRPEKILPEFEKLFLACFKGICVPRLEDEDHQGLLLESARGDSFSPLHILEEGARLIRSLFILTCKNACTLLPNLPPEFHAGRMVNLQWKPFGEIDLEWTKKTLRQLHFRSLADGNICFHFQPHLHTFRLRQHRKERGIILRCGEPIEIKSGSHYLLDQFQK